jgi:hypothetical protein
MNKAATAEPLLPRRVGIGVGSLVAATLLAWSLVLGWPSRTDVEVTSTPNGAVGQVNGATLALTLPPGQVPTTGHAGWYIAAPDDSLYYQPADPALPLGWLGQVGEAIQWARPRAQWRIPARQPDPAWHPLYGADPGFGAVAAVAPAWVLPPGRQITGQLVGGRVAAGLFIHLDADENGYGFILRPERRIMAWWQVTHGVPTTLLSQDRYQPTIAATLADLAQEAALAGSAALGLLLLAGLLAVLGRGLRRERPRAPDTRPALEPDRRAAPGGPRSDGPRIAGPLLAALPLLAFGLAGLIGGLAVSLGPLEGIPHVQDEVAYLWQAKIFALGRAWVPAPPDPPFFDQAFIEIDPPRWFSKYPPGWPLLLAVGARLAVPWLINPLLAGASLALIYATGRRLYGTSAGSWAALLGSLSPFVLFLSGSYMAHPAVMFLTAAALYGFVRVTSGPAPGTVPRRPITIGLSLAVGLCLGWAFITRQATALGVAVPFVIWGLADSAGAVAGWVRRKASPHETVQRVLPYLLMTAGGLIPVLLLGAVNQEQMGSPLLMAQELVGDYNRLGFGPGIGSEPGGHTPALGLYNVLVYLRSLEGVLFGWPLPLTLAPLLVALAATIGSRPAQARWTLFCLAGFLALAGIYYTYWAAQTIYGPRYWYEALPFLLLLSGRGLQLLGQGAARLLGGAAAAARAAAWVVPLVLAGPWILFNLFQVLPAQWRAYTGYNGITASSLNRVEAAHLDRALVFVALQPDAPQRDYDKVLFANDPLLRGPVVYVRSFSPRRNQQLLPAFPDRTPYYLPLTGPPHPGVGP